MSQVHAVEHSAPERTTLATYVVGFILSVLLTLLAFWLIGTHRLHGGAGLFAIFSLALLQFIVQVLCFLHLAEDRRPRYKLLAFVSMVVVVIILAGGSLWIMNNLNYHMMAPLSPSQQKQYLHTNEGL
jgi:cytochrome o ubiquinol oxidase operon protein cyoD